MIRAPNSGPTVFSLMNGIGTCALSTLSGSVIALLMLPTVCAPLTIRRLPKRNDTSSTSASDFPRSRTTR